MKQAICFFVFLLANVSFAQTLSVFTEDDGLIDNSINCAALNQDENLWLGTQEGLSFFDGTSFTNFDDTNLQGLLNNSITALAIDQENNLWIGTDFGLHKLEGSVLTTFTVDNSGLGNNRIRYLLSEINGGMLVAHNNGFSILEDNDWTDYGMSDGIPFGGVNYIAVDELGLIWLSTPLSGVLLFDGGSFEAFTTDEGLVKNNVRCVAIDKENNKWIGTSAGISVLDTNNELLATHEYIFTLPPPDSLNPIEDIEIACNGVVWAAVYADYLVTEGGISLYDEMQWDDLDVEDGLSGPVVRAVISDSKNTVWVATSTGLTKIENDPCISANEELEGLTSISIYPNPCFNHLTIECDLSKFEVNYQIFNLLGSSMQSGKIHSSKEKIELNALPNGIYSLVLNEGLYAYKFVVSN